jgi:hypothetical protein
MGQVLAKVIDMGGPFVPLIDVVMATTCVNSVTQIAFLRNWSQQMNDDDSNTIQMMFVSLIVVSYSMTCNKISWLLIVYVHHTRVKRRCKHYPIVINIGKDKDFQFWKPPSLWPIFRRHLNQLQLCEMSIRLCYFYNSCDIPQYFLLVKSKTRHVLVRVRLNSKSCQII